MLPLGLMDIASAGLLLSRAFQADVSLLILIIFGGYLLVKGFLFPLDIGGLMDIMGGGLLLLSLWVVFPPSLFLIAALLVGLKGIMSLIPRF